MPALCSSWAVEKEVHCILDDARAEDTVRRVYSSNAVEVAIQKTTVAGHQLVQLAGRFPFPKVTELLGVEQWWRVPCCLADCSLGGFHWKMDVTLGDLGTSRSQAIYFVIEE